jgi:RNA 2',3'-cyclic 3'-phosphodiesterase
MRLFIGIPLENKAQEQLTGLYKEFNGIKTVKKEYLHITMQFLGDLDEWEVEPISKALERACEGFKEFGISSTRISAFPNAHRAKAVWANVDKGSGPVKKLFKEIEKALAGIKYEKEERAYIPHVTLGRSKQGVDVTKQALELKFDIQSHVGKVALFSSVLGDDGPVYTKIFEKILGNRE